MIFIEYMSHWSWPSRIHGKHLHEIFSEDTKDKRREAKRIKAQASDMLSIVGVTKVFIAKVIMVGVLEANDCSVALLALIRVIETIAEAPRRDIVPNEVLDQSQRFFELFTKARGLDDIIQKFHWLLHFHQPVLLNCFCLERKRRVPKRYAGDLTNCSKKASESLAMECTSNHLGQLAQPDTFNFDVGLVGAKPAPKRLCRLVCEALQTGPLSIMYSAESRFSKLGTCKKSCI